MSTEHSKDFYSLSADEKLNALYDINLRTSNDMLEVRKLVDPVRGPSRVIILTISSFLGGAAVQVAFLALLAVSCR